MDGLTSQIRILLIEDSEDDAKLLEHELRRAGHDAVLVRVETREAMQQALRGCTWDMIISDYSMPRFSGPEAFAVLRASGLDIPFIIVSGTVGEEIAVQTMKLGVQDYILKGNLRRLSPAIERELREWGQRDARRRAERELILSEQRYRALFEGTPVPMWVVDLETQRFLAVNAEAILLYGYSAEEFATLHVSAIEDARNADLARKSIGEDIDAATTWHLRKDRTLIAAEIKTHELEFSGRRARLVAVNDVTQRQEAARALRKAEEQLRQAQKMEAVGCLAGGIAHDFNNLLSVILGYTSMMLDDVKFDAGAVADVREVHRAGERASELTRQLLAFSRRQVLQPRVLDLNQVVRGLESMLRRVLGEDIEFSLQTLDGLGKVHADPGQVEQIIMNLVVNARDAMPRGGKLMIRTVNSDSTHVMLAVTDTGVGMDKATQDRIFEPFFTTKEMGKGTGLGLSTVYGIVSQSNGRISVRSEPGKGTTFHVYFPRTDKQESSLANASPPARLDGTETILLVEDDDQVRAIEVTILRRRGYKVLEAQDGEEAIMVASKHVGPIDLLLTDVIMPKMSGRELAERLLPSRPETKTLYVSGYTLDSTIRHGVVDSAAGFLQKPFTPDKLALKVRQLLDATAKHGDDPA